MLLLLRLYNGEEEAVVYNLSKTKKCWLRGERKKRIVVSSVFISADQCRRRRRTTFVERTRLGHNGKERQIDGQVKTRFDSFC